MKINYLENADCMNQMQKIPDESIDLIIADPPYFQIYGDFDFNIFKTHKEYLIWCKKWLLESRRILKKKEVYYFGEHLVKGK